MRVIFFAIISISLFNCASRKAIQRVVDAHANSFPLRQLQGQWPDSVESTSVTVNPGVPLPSKSEVVHAGFFMLPILVYNHFQSGYQILLGQDAFDGSWREYTNQRLLAFAKELSSNGITNVKVEVSKAMANGKYVSGHVYIVYPGYYTNMVQSLNLSKSKNATAELALRLSWRDASGVEESRDASIKIKVDKQGEYSAQVRTLLGKTVNLTSHDIQYHFTHDIVSNPPFFGSEPYLTVHLFRLCDLMVLGLDELCEVVLMESREEEVKPLPASYAGDMLRARNLLWEQLKNKKLGTRLAKGFSPSGGFRSGIYYDFISNQAKLTIDVGLQRKTFPVEQYLFSMGQNTSTYSHLYFSMEEVLNNLPEVLAKIKQALQ